MNYVLKYIEKFSDTLVPWCGVGVGGLRYTAISHVNLTAGEVVDNEDSELRRLQRNSVWVDWTNMMMMIA